MTRVPIGIVVITTAALLLPNHAAAQEAAAPIRSSVAQAIAATIAPQRLHLQPFQRQRPSTGLHSRKSCMVKKTVVGLLSGFVMSLPVGAVIENSRISNKIMIIGTAGGTLIGMAIGRATCH